ncbi:MAG: CBS domain-containing protein [Alphaproteobacteria bacterium]|jgi:predicted transcriptional regulator|nr:CBS domain-containing protein [Alphaproteobacteria bacterium]MBT7942700.1 CBS domain-containing protein [Alphaproteobacteria bacterium]
MTEKKITTVSDVMSKGVITIEPTATVHDAVKLMRQHSTSSLVVERRDAADEFGLIVVTDIASEVLGKDLAPERVNVYEVMSKPVLTLAAEMNVLYAVRMLSRFNLSRALVVDHARNPLGLVTLRDMVLRSLED